MPANRRLHLFVRSICVLAIAVALVSTAAAQGGLGPKTQLLKKYDKNGDGYLNKAERLVARGLTGKETERFNNTTLYKGKKISPSEVKTYSNEPFYDMHTVRTLFLDFEDADWENEMADFYHTDIDLPATLTVDGKVYKDVGVHYRGLTSYRVSAPGKKASLSIEMNMVHKAQRLLGYQALNLMNSNADPTFMRIALYQEVARRYSAAAKVNWVRVIINGEDWGIYVNSQQFNADFTRDFFKSTQGARWKVPGPGSGSLDYWGDDAASYKYSYEIKTKDAPESWAVLIRLCKVLNTTPADKLEAALKPILDVDGALKFLAIDKALINCDGYWTRASDYALYLDTYGRFHIIAQDANETWREVEHGGGVQLDPFTGRGALISKLLSVPALQERYLSYMRDIAENWLDWAKIGPKVTEYQALIADYVKSDTHKLDTTENFSAAVTKDGGGGVFSGRPRLGLKSFCEQRRAYLLSYPGIKREQATQK